MADFAVAQLDDMVCHLPDRFVMRHHNDRISVFLIYLLNELQNFLGGRIIKCAGRLVAEQNIRIFDDCSAD